MNALDSFAGKSTRARLSSLTSSNQTKRLRLYERHLTKRYEHSRFAEVIEWFWRREVKIENPASCEEELGKVAANAKTSLKVIPGPIFFFTDGSSQPGRSNSGVSLVASDSTGTSLFVRTDGNNFLAELIGVTLACLVAPRDKRCIIVSDSKAVLESIHPGRVSDRRVGFSVVVPCSFSSFVRLSAYSLSHR